MASFVSQHQATGYDTVKPYEPDFSWMSGVLQTKENQYEKGLSEIASGYSSIVNQPITSFENIEKRKEYINAAQEGLKKITTQDLSKDKNVRQAEALYAPFWEDEDILYDIGHTQKLKKQLSRAEADAHSKDKNVLNSYNPDSVTRLEWAMKDLREAPRDGKAIRNIEIPDYMPYKNPLDRVTEVSKATDFKGVILQHREGATLVTTTNGLQAMPYLTTMVNGILQDDYNAQFQTRGYNIYRSQKAAIERDHPEYTSQQILEELTNQHYDKYIQTTYNKPLQHTEDAIQVAKQGIEDIRSKKVLTKSDEAAIHQLEQQIKDAEMYTGHLEAKRRQDLYNADGTMKSSEQRFSEFNKNPALYYGAIEREDHINQIAGQIGSQYQYKEDIDPVYKFESEQNVHWANYNLNVKKYKEDVAQHGESNKIEWAKIQKDYDLADATGGTGGGYGYRGKASPDKTVANEGPATTFVEHTEDIGTTLEDDKNNALNVLNSKMFSSGLTNNLLGRIGIAPEDIQQFNGLLSTRFTPENIDNEKMSWTPKQRDAWMRVTGELKRRGYMKESTGYAAMDGIGNLLTSQMANASNVQVPAGSEEDIKADRDNLANMYMEWKGVIDAKNKYQGLKQTQADLVKNILTKDTQGKFTKLRNERGYIAGTGDYAKILPTVKVQGPEGIRILRPIDLANAYSHGTMVVDRDNLNIDGVTYKVLETNGEPDAPQVYNTTIGQGKRTERHLLDETIRNVLIPRYGSYEERNKLNGELYKAMPSTEQYQDKTGAIGSKLKWPIGKPGGGFNEAIITEALNPANMADGRVYMDSKELEPAQVEAIKSYLRSPEAIIEKKVQARYNNVSDRHVPTMEITLPKDDDVLGSVSGKTVTIPIRKNAPGDALSVLRSDGITIYDKISRGEKLSSSPQDEQAGVRYELSRDNPNDINTYSFKWWTKEINEKGQEEWKRQRTEVVPLGKVSADGVKNVIDTKVKSSLMFLWNQRDQYNKKHPAQ